MKGRPRATVLTAPTRGAIAVVRAWGPGASEVVSAAFRPARGPALKDSAPGRPRFGRLGRGAGDEVVAVIETGEGTDDEAVEVHCHGGPAAVALVIEALAEAGAEIVPDSSWIAAEAPGPIAAQALMDLAKAPTARVAEVLLDQATGVLDSEFALLESSVNSVDPAIRSRGIIGLDALEARAAVGLRLLGGWTVAIVGRPNAGKSRLLNAILGYERAIVDPTAGTTRDAILATTAVDGWPVAFVDTAGLRDSDDPIEAEGVRIARDRGAEADLVLLVVDRSEPPPDESGPLQAADSSRCLLVLNKSDLPTALTIDPPGSIAVSAATGASLDRLLAAVARRLVPDPPPPGSGVPFRPDHLARIAEIRSIGGVGPGESRTAHPRGGDP